MTPRARKTAEPTPAAEPEIEIVSNGPISIAVPKKRTGRTVSALITATREYEAAHKAADKARAALAKVQPLVDTLADAEKAEQAALSALQEQLGIAPINPFN